MTEPIRPHSILVVDDHSSLRELIQTILTDAGYHVMTAESGDEALRIAATHPVDLLLTDLGIPGMNGDALVQNFRVNGWHPRIVIMSGTEPTGAKGRAGMEFLQKPFTPKSLRAIISRTLNNEHLA
jgi:DNA-binding response OmpR family regulator